MISSSQTSEQELEFIKMVKKLVDSTNWPLKKFPASEIADIVNALGERIENKKESGENITLLLRGLLIIATNTSLEPHRVERYTVRYKLSINVS